MKGIKRHICFLYSVHLSTRKRVPAGFFGRAPTTFSLSVSFFTVFSLSLLLVLFFCLPLFSFSIFHTHSTPFILCVLFFFKTPLSSCPTFHPSFRGSAQLKSYRPLHIDIVRLRQIHLLLLLPQEHQRPQKNFHQVIPNLIMATWLVIHCHVVALLVLLGEQLLLLQPTALVRPCEPCQEKHKMENLRMYLDLSFSTTNDVKTGLSLWQHD